MVESVTRVSRRRALRRYAQLPAGLAVDQQDADLVVDDLDGNRAAVVVLPGVARERFDRHGEGHSSWLVEGDGKRDDRSRGILPWPGPARSDASARRRGDRA